MKNNHEKNDQFKINSAVSWTPIQLLFIGMLICASLVNIIQFPAIDSNMISNNYPALKGYESFDLVEIGRKYSGGIIRGRYGPYLGLSQVAPDSDIIVSNNCPLTNEMLYGLGLARSVERLNYDAEQIFQYFEPDDYEVIRLGSSKDQSPGNVSIILDQKKHSKLVVLKHIDTWYLIDINLLPVNVVRELIE